MQRFVRGELHRDASTAFFGAIARITGSFLCSGVWVSIFLKRTRRVIRVAIWHFGAVFDKSEPPATRMWASARPARHPFDLLRAGSASYGRVVVQRSSACKGRATGRSILEKTLAYRPATLSTLSFVEGHKRWSF